MGHPGVARRLSVARRSPRSPGSASFPGVELAGPSARCPAIPRHPVSRQEGAPRSRFRARLQPGARTTARRAYRFESNGSAERIWVACLSSCRRPGPRFRPRTLFRRRRRPARTVRRRPATETADHAAARPADVAARTVHRRRSRTVHRRRSPGRGMQWPTAHARGPPARLVADRALVVARARARDRVGRTRRPGLRAFRGRQVVDGIRRPDRRPCRRWMTRGRSSTCPGSDVRSITPPARTIALDLRRRSRPALDAEDPRRARTPPRTRDLLRDRQPRRGPVGIVRREVASGNDVGEPHLHPHRPHARARVAQPPRAAPHRGRARGGDRSPQHPVAAAVFERRDAAATDTLRAWRDVARQGYLVVVSTLDTDDWQPHVTASEIVQRATPPGTAGGDRPDARRRRRSRRDGRRARPTDPGTASRAAIASSPSATWRASPSRR